MRLTKSWCRLLPVLLLTGSLVAVFQVHGQGPEEAEFQPKPGDYEPFLGRWEGKWDATWPVRIDVRKSAGGSLEAVYEWKEFVTDEDYTRSEFKEVVLIERGKLRIGTGVILEIPRRDDDGGTLYGMLSNTAGVRRSILKRSGG